MPGPKNLLVDIWLLSCVSTSLVAEELAGSPLSVDEFALYGLISDLGPVTATQLSQWTGTPATTLSALLRRCQARGELARPPSAADRRSVSVELTAQGREVYRAALPALVRALDRFHDHADPAVEETRHALQRVDAAVRAALGLPERPYQLEDPDVAGGAAAEDPLTPAQAAEVRAFTAWIRHRDSTGG